MNQLVPRQRPPAAIRFAIKTNSHIINRFQGEMDVCIHVDRD